MKFKPNPLLYGANRSFLSSFKLVITLCDPIDGDTLARAVHKAMVRYPYFCVRPERVGNEILLRNNPLPVPVFPDGRTAVLGTEECGGHLLTFGYEGRTILLNASHCIADGMGIDPLLKTVLYLYISERYGAEGIATERILMPDSPISEAEYAYPFPEAPISVHEDWPQKQAPDCVYGLDDGAFDKDGLYAYHLHIPQRAMMATANPSDGSPVSFLTVMMYRALCALDEGLDRSVVTHVQHQYRFALKTPVNRHSLVNYVPVALSPRSKIRSVEHQNTVIRGQIILGSEISDDLGAVNRLLEAFPQGENATLEDKKKAMADYMEKSISGKTFGISYVGKMDWCGMDRYVEDLHAYIGEKNTPNMLLMEVMTVGEDFTVNFMQSGRGTRYVSAFMEQLRLLAIPVKLVGETRYTLCDTEIP